MRSKESPRSETSARAPRSPAAIRSATPATASARRITRAFRSRPTPRLAATTMASAISRPPAIFSSKSRCPAASRPMTSSNPSGSLAAVALSVIGPDRVRELTLPQPPSDSGVGGVSRSPPMRRPAGSKTA